MRNHRWSITGLLTCILPVGCAAPCLDDGLGQELCSGQNSENSTTNGSPSSGGTSDNTSTTSTASTASTDSGPDSSTGADETQGIADSTGGTTSTGTTGATGETGTTGETDTLEEVLWCIDLDDDGFGNSDDCVLSATPIEGRIDNSEDCDDQNSGTFPGAAELDGAITDCKKDEDNDGYGDTNPPPGVSPGVDCVDTNANVFPGIAQFEIPNTICAEDEDNDGYGDTNPPLGAVPGTDCVDTNPSVFPGIAEFEMPADLCAADEDNDNYGDIDPPPGAEPGNDCDDTNAYAFPGAAVLESPNDLCMLDADEDGWADTNPGSSGGFGPVPGHDCYDGNADLNPTTLQLMAILPTGGLADEDRSLVLVDENNASLTPFATLQTEMGDIPNVNLITATIGDSGVIYANDVSSAQLYNIDYTATCMVEQTGVVTPVGEGPYGMPGDVICGLEFGDDGQLYGVDHIDRLVSFDPISGALTVEGSIEANGVPVNIDSCGITFNCADGTFLIANGIDKSIYSVDPQDPDNTTLLRDLSPYFVDSWPSASLAFWPMSSTVLLSTGDSLYRVDLVADAPPQLVGAFAEPVSNLQYFPMCM